MDSINFFNGYGKVNPSESDQSSTNQNSKTTQKNNITIVISIALISSLIIICALIGTLIHDSSATDSSTHPSSLSFNSSESLNTVCSVTQHPDSCFTTISSLNNPSKPDPIQFYNLSLQVTLQELKNISSFPNSLIPKSTDKGSEAALNDCVNLFDDAVSQLSNCLEEMKKVGPDEKVITEMEVRNMQTWISAAMTDQETCVDGLVEMESSFVDEVKVKMQKSKEYMSNSLAILDNIDSLLQKFGLTMP